MAVAHKVSLNLSLVFDVVVFFANYLFPIFIETFFLSGLFASFGMLNKSQGKCLHL